MDGTHAERLKKIKDYALAGGAYRAELTLANQIVVDERVRFKCQVPYCPDYGRNLRCPPNTMSIAEFKDVLAKYSNAMLVQIKSGGSDENSLVNAERTVQLLLGELEKKALGLGFYFAAGLGAACCRICPECVGVSSGLPCRNPGQARPSAEAMGIDVIKTADKTGLPFSLDDPGEVIYTGVLLLD